MARNKMTENTMSENTNREKAAKALEFTMSNYVTTKTVTVHDYSKLRNLLSRRLRELPATYRFNYSLPNNIPEDIISISRWDDQIEVYTDNTFMDLPYQMVGTEEQFRKFLNELISKEKAKKKAKEEKLLMEELATYQRLKDKFEKQDY